MDTDDHGHRYGTRTRRATIDKMIADCEAVAAKHRPPPPMQSYVSGPPAWLFWGFVCVAAFGGGFWIVATIYLFTHR